jgi:NAD(P) transhydrogenase subunit alpha
MLLGVLRESYPGERRVALIPSSVPGLVKAGFDVVVEAGAGVAAGFDDQQYLDKGARVVASRDEALAADVILQVRTAGANPQAGRQDFQRFRAAQTLIGMADPLGSPQVLADLACTGVNLFALELLPRITRAQNMDVLSSQATIAGYQAVLLAALELPKMFPMLITAAGTIHAAKVLIVGAGVAGLQAIATAKRLGAVVSAYDVRAAVKEQVQSLGAKFVEIPMEATKAEGQGGYAQAMDEEFYRKQRELMARVVAESDVVITTAAVPGKRSPILVTADMVAGMSAGSVIVDLAAERGGNCELTEAGKTVVKNGVSIMGPVDLPAEVPNHASQLYAKNITAFLQYIVKGGKIDLDQDDEIIRETLVTRAGQVTHPRVLAALNPPAAG